MLCKREISIARRLGRSNATKAASKTLSFSSTLGKGPVVFNSRAASVALTASAGEVGLAIGALEDNDGDDDAATGICGWVLSFRDKPKLYSLFLTETRLLPITREMSLKPFPPSTSCRKCRSSSIDHGLPLNQTSPSIFSAVTFGRMVLRVIDTNTATKTNERNQNTCYAGNVPKLLYCFCPHSRQKFAEDSIRVLHLGQIFSTIG